MIIVLVMDIIIVVKYLDAKYMLMDAIHALVRIMVDHWEPCTLMNCQESINPAECKECGYGVLRNGQCLDD